MCTGKTQASLYPVVLKFWMNQKVCLDLKAGCTIETNACKSNYYFVI